MSILSVDDLDFVPRVKCEEESIGAESEDAAIGRFVTRKYG